MTMTDKKKGNAESGLAGAVGVSISPAQGAALLEDPESFAINPIALLTSPDCVQAQGPENDVTSRERATRALRVVALIFDAIGSNRDEDDVYLERMHRIVAENGGGGEILANLSSLVHMAHGIALDIAGDLMCDAHKKAVGTIARAVIAEQATFPFGRAEDEDAADETPEITRDIRGGVNVNGPMPRMPDIKS